jgi:glycosyltransferase involved in cell wall biosynthesis
MAERKRLGLIFCNSENWIGGTYYILNLVRALNTLEDHEKLEILVITPKVEDFNLLVRETTYPYLIWYDYRLYRYSLIERVINKAGKIILRRQLIQKKIKAKLDALFPSSWNEMFYSTISEDKKLYWIPDFQEAHYPDFFSEMEIQSRKSFQFNIASNKTRIILSSNDAKADFNQLYPNALSKTYVVPFAVTHPEYADIPISDLKEKYLLPEKYFISPNQFWKHKNHRVIIGAVENLIKEGIYTTVVFTGKEYDYRVPGFTEELKKVIFEKSLENVVRFLGFIDRREQLQLMNHSIAVIQPSLFEGWSTVVEDAKAMNKFVLASDIKVHREQLLANADFFDPHDSQLLASLMRQLLDDPPDIEHSAYKEDVERFGRKFMEAALEV